MCLDLVSECYCYHYSVLECACNDWSTEELYSVQNLCQKKISWQLSESSYVPQTKDTETQSQRKRPRPRKTGNHREKDPEPRGRLTPLPWLHWSFSLWWSCLQWFSGSAPSPETHSAQVTNMLGPQLTSINNSTRHWVGREEGGGGMLGPKLI